jgi:hypothetical protein
LTRWLVPELMAFPASPAQHKASPYGAKASMVREQIGKLGDVVGVMLRWGYAAKRIRLAAENVAT